MENKYRDLRYLPMTLRVEDLMPLLGIGRNTAYELIRSGRIRSVRIGRQIRIPREALREFLDGRKFQMTIPQRKNLRDDLLLSYNNIMIFPARQKEGIIHAA